MATPTFDTIEAQASYGIGLQVGQQLSESGLQGLLPEALVAGIADALEGNQPQVPVEAGFCLTRCDRSATAAQCPVRTAAARIDTVGKQAAASAPDLAARPESAPGRRAPSDRHRSRSAYW